MKDDRMYLLHIRDALGNIREYTTPGREAFFNDRKTQDAVIRNLEIIGEAVKHMSASLKATHNTIAWKQIAGMRDRLIHDYFGVDLNLVWDVVASELPQLERKTNQILGHPEKPTGPNS
ncbi:HepT-like ribonuclease domain-containing protein [Candidatus Nitrospira allomarina]|uniref:DUF86 domain-containing protein n=1 Tax=Candidatus Nitrospira allomarina TaxID=3020900 RepID=A0AA96GA83_9BACT|nr:DUF86 domain-containing protein [Candidatus Nitrospira allomarina]WNM57322.1 DUF86 domain-containing protein [Candidatus Nitrospira allomarina]